MASRVRVAVSACLVASGLIIAGAGGAMALADPGHDYGRSDDAKHDDADHPTHGGSIGDVIRRAFDLDGGNGADATKDEPRDGPHTRWGNGRTDQESTGENEVPRTGTSPTHDSTVRESPTTIKESPTDETSPTKTSTSETQSPCPDRSSECNPPPGNPAPNPPASGGGGGGAIVGLPRYAPPKVPDMQLPQRLTPEQPGVPGGPGVLDAGAGATALAPPVGPPAPLTLPVIVAPPMGLGGAAGGAGGPAAPRVGPSPNVKSIITEPPGGRVPPPANVGNNVAIPNASYRLGYTEYLRTAGLPQVAALAVPGMVGILVLTGAGGLVGYRQAKAGHAVRVASSARFMR